MKALSPPIRRTVTEYEAQDLGTHLRAYYSAAGPLVRAAILVRGTGAHLAEGMAATPEAALAVALEALRDLHAAMGEVLP